MMRIAIFVIIFLVFVPVWGCDEDGHGTAYGQFYVRDCGLNESDLNLSIDHVTSAYFENTLLLRLQHSTQNYTFADGLLLEIRDVASVAAHLGEPIQITLVPDLAEFKQSGPTIETGDKTGYPATPYNGPARASLYLFDTCPDSQVGFADGEGAVTFSHIYEPGASDRIRGSFALEFVDPRTWQSPEEFGDFAVVSGDFDFVHSERNTGQP